MSFLRVSYLQLGSDGGYFAEKLKKKEFPEDWGNDEQKFLDENGLNLLHYCILKGFGDAVKALVKDFEFGKFFIFCMLY